MLMRIKKNLDGGLQQIRWFSSLVRERLRVELAVVKLLKESEDMERKRSELVRQMGERVFELRSRKDADILNDVKIKQAIGELEALDAELEETKRRASEIGGAGQ